ncbi:MAG TPA: hypothetical protein VFR99_12830, partial [Marmoricola sp.]|nr:hypothetical protein [Marmoricola sp.]
STDPAVARRLLVEAWTRRRPGSDPGRAADLLAPLAALQRAVVYRGFLDRIEPDERVYHRDDPARWLRRAAASVSTSRARP